MNECGEDFILGIRWRKFVFVFRDFIVCLMKYDVGFLNKRINYRFYLNNYNVYYFELF